MKKEIKEKSKPEEWGREFNEKILYPKIKGWGIEPTQIVSIKSFIHTLLVQEKQKSYQEGFNKAIELEKFAVKKVA